MIIMPDTPNPAIDKAREEGRNEAFAAMMKHADAIILGASNTPHPIYDMFMKAIHAAAAGELPKRPSLSFSERREIAKEFVSQHGANLFD